MPLITNLMQAPLHRLPYGCLSRALQNPITGPGIFGHRIEGLTPLDLKPSPEDHQAHRGQPK